MSRFILIATSGSEAGLTFQQLKVFGVALAGVVALMFAIRALGLFLARTHPDPTPSIRGRSQEIEAQVPVPDSVSPEILAVLAAAVQTVVQGNFRIVAVATPRKPNIESVLQHWSIEGRRQIYSSHQFR